MKELGYVSSNGIETTESTSEICSWWNNGVMWALITDETAIVLEAEWNDTDIASYIAKKRPWCV